MEAAITVHDLVVATAAVAAIPPQHRGRCFASPIVFETALAVVGHEIEGNLPLQSPKAPAAALHKLG
jgi:hypothetical protein